MGNSLLKTGPETDFFIVLIVSIGIILFFITTVISLLYLTQRRQNKYQKEVQNLENAFQQELLRTQLEIQEQTLKHVSREIHDNIGQVLSFVKLNLSVTTVLSSAEKQEKIDDCRELVAEVINDLRDLSKSLSLDHIAAKGLVTTIRAEVEKISKVRIINISLHIEGSVFNMGSQTELVLFRIFQESVNNALKHADAKNLMINLQYSPELFTLTVEDDGVGFDPEKTVNDKTGLGLTNIRNRATLIGAKVLFDSKLGGGCKVNVLLNLFEQQVFTDEAHSSSPG